jgi:hypothetical protein
MELTSFPVMETLSSALPGVMVADHGLLDTAMEPHGSQFERKVGPYGGHSLLVCGPPGAGIGKTNS